MTDLDEPLAQALRAAVPQPPHEIDPESLRSAAPLRRRRALGPALVAAAVTVIALGVGLAARPHNAPSGAPRNGLNRHAGPTGNGSPTVRTPATRQPPPVNHGPGPDFITAHFVARLLAAAPTVPGAATVDHSPVKALDRPMSEPASANLVRRTHWWTAAGTMTTALRYFRTHPPAGANASGGGSASDAGVVTVRGLDFDATGSQWRGTGIFTQLELMVAVAPAPGGVAIRVDAEAIWLPERTAAEHIPGDVTSVHVVVDRSGRATTVRRTLGTADARSLAAVVDGLAVSTPGLISCPIDFGWTDTLTFHGPQGEVHIDAAPGGCSPVHVGPRSEHNPTLSGGRAVDQALLRALGLPSTYGQ